MSQVKKEKKYILDNTQLMAQWDWEKNTISPEKLTYGSNKRIWWKCDVCGYEWGATINHRTSGTDCPECAKQKRGIKRSKIAAQVNGLAEKYPELAQEWHPTKNESLSVLDVSARSNKSIWWICSFCGDEWEDTVAHRASGRGCPNCSKAQTSYAEQTVFSISPRYILMQRVGTKKDMSLISIFHRKK